MSRTASDAIPATLEEATALIESQQVSMERQQDVIESLQRDLRLLRSQLGMQLRGRFGQSSERFEDPHQLGLFGKIVSEKSDTEAETPPPKQKPRTRKRAAFGEGLRREENKQDVPEELKLCGCCNPPEEMVIVSYETTETLEIVAPDVFVKADMRPKLACPNKQGDIIAPLVKPRVLPRARVGVSMLVYILVSKYQDHRVPSQAMCEMREGPSQPGCRTWLQTTLNCSGKEPGW